MKRHGSMNRIYRLVWSQVTNTWVAVAETTRGRGKGGRRKLVAAALSLTATLAHAGPTGGKVVSGTGAINQSGATTTVTQGSPTLSLNWTTFNVAPQETVNFVQPSASAVAVNNILDINGSQILGKLNANGQVYLINPNGILFGKDAQVNVGGLVASTLNLTDGANSSSRTFSGSGSGSVVNEGTITAANGGYVALLGNHVSNQGVITAQLGTVGLGAGNAVTLTFDGNSLLHLQVDQSVLNSLAENGGLIQANGGQVVMTAGAADSLLASVVNNTGIIDARTVQNIDGKITLLGGMTAGTVNVSGTLDASAPNGGNGGAIETSAANVKIGDSAVITTAAVSGLNGSWLIDPNDFNIMPTGGDISGANLSTALSTSNVTIQTTATTPSCTNATCSTGASGSGNINVDDTVSWSSAHTLTLEAYNDININSTVTASGAANLTMTTGGSGTTNVSSGNLNIGMTTSGMFAGALNFSGSGALSINGHTYTVITNASQLTSDLVSNLSGYYALGSNVTLSSGATATGQGVTSFPAQFTGTFDGLGHTVSGLSISAPNALGVGLFGVNDGTIQNLAVSGTISMGGGIDGATVGGLLAGANVGTIRNSYTNGSINGTTDTAAIGGLVGLNGGAIYNSHSSATMYSTDGTAGSMGGLVGANYGGTISNSYSTGSVSGANYVGGLVGLNSPNVNYNSSPFINTPGSVSLITNSYSTGSVSGGSYLGGLVGVNLGSSSVQAAITNSYATGAVTGGTGVANVGGLVGSQGRNGTSASEASVTNSYSSGSVSAGSSSTNLGGLIGCNNCGPGITPAAGTAGTVIGSFWNTTSSNQGSSAGGTGLSTLDSSSNSNFVGAGWDTANVWLLGGTSPLLIADMIPLTVVATDVSKTYDGATFGAGGYSVNYSVPGASLSGTVSYGGTSQTATSAGSYSIIPSGLSVTSPTQQGYYLTYENGTLTINKLALTATIATGNSTYGATLSPGAVTFTNLVSGDNVTASTVTVNAAGQTSTSGHLTAGTHSGAESVGTSISGTSAGNYTFAGATGDYVVSKLTLTGSIATGSSTYGSTTSPGAVSFTNAISGDSVSSGSSVTLNTSGLTSASSNLVAGTHAGIESVGTSLTGSDSGNYTFAGATGTYIVSPLALTGVISTGSSTYGSSLVPGTASFTNAISGDNVSAGGTVSVNTTSLTSGSNHLVAGTHTGIESISSSLTGSDSGNYTFAGATGDYVVSKLALTGSVTTGGSTYGASLTPGSVTFTNAISGDTLGTATVAVNISGQTSTSGHLTAGTHAGVEVVSSLSGSDGSNYTFAGVTGDYVVSQLALTGVIATGSSTYGSSLTPGAASFTNAISGDNVSAGGTVSVNTTSLTSGSNNLVAGTHAGIESVSGSLTGSDNGNYTFTGATGDYVVSKLALTGSIVNGSSTYGSTLTPGAATFTNAISGDTLGTATVAVNTSGQTSSSGHLTAGTHAGTEVVSSLSGADAGNYTYTGVTGDYVVSKLALTGTIATGSSTYGSTTSPGAVSFTNAISGDAVSAGSSVTLNTSSLTSTSNNLIAGTHAGIESVGTSLTGSDSGNYTFAGATGDYIVSPLALTGVISTGSSTYGSSLSPGTVSFTNAVSGDNVSAGGSVSVNTTSLTSSSNNLVAGSHTGIESISSSLTGSDSGNYTFAGATGDYVVSKLALTGSIATGSSTYGSTLTPGAATFTNAISGDVLGTATIAVNAGSSTSSSGNLTAGSHGGIESISSLSGSDAGNYTYAGVTGSYIVSQLALTGVIATGSSTYGSSLTPGAASFTNAISGDNVSAGGTVSVNTTSLTSGSGNLTAGTHTGIESISGSLTGSDNSNYTFAGATGNYVVSKLALTGNVASGSSTYGSTLTPGAATFTNAISGDALGTATVAVNTAGQTSSSGNLTAGSHTGVEAVSSLSGADAGNYTYAGVTGSYTVSKLALTGTLQTGSSVYGSSLTPGALSFGNEISGDNVTAASVTVNITGQTSTSGHLTAGSHTGIESTTGSLSGVDAGNYTFTGSTGSYVVSQLAISGSINTGTSTYGSSLNPGSVSLSNTIVGDIVAAPTASVSTTGLLSSSGNLIAGSHAGIESANGALSGADAGNYSFSGATGNYVVNKLPVTISATGTNKVYDGTVNDTVMLSGSGIITGDAVNLSSTSATFASKNVGTGIAVTVSGISATGADASNYQFGNGTASTTANITPLSITVSATGTNKVYDGTTAATVTLSGGLAGDSISFTDNSASFANQNVGTGKTVTVSGISATGADAGNYVVSNTTTSTTANITPATLTVSGESAANKVYDGTTAATLTGGNLVGVVAADAGTLTLTNAGSFTSKNVGTGVSVTTEDTLSGNSAGNYVLVQPTGVSANITPATLTYTATPATLNSGQTPSGLSGTVSGFVANETLASATQGNLTWSTNANATSAPGKYAIDGGGLTAQNYVFDQAGSNATALTLKQGPVTVVPVNIQNVIASLDFLTFLEGFSFKLPIEIIVANNINGAGLKVINGGVKLPDNLVIINQ